MTTQHTVSTLAADARKHFEQITRDEQTIWTRTDDAPEWVRDLCFAAHDAGDMLPDDWRYEFIVAALDALEDHDDEDDARDSIEADIYTHDLTTWLASRVDRTGYVDDACEEYGTDAPQGIVERLQVGQLAEKREVFESVLSSLSDRLDALQDDEPTDDDA